MSPHEAVVGVGRYRVARAPERLRALGVGSCLAISLYDPERRLGGLAHVPLPARRSPEDPAGRFVDSAVEALLEELVARGSRPKDLEAKAAGGASLLRGSEPSRARPIAQLNVKALRDVLDGLGLRLVASDLGGRAARSVTLDTESGELRVLLLPDRVRAL